MVSGGIKYRSEVPGNPTFRHLLSLKTKIPRLSRNFSKNDSCYMGSPHNCETSNAENSGLFLMPVTPKITAQILISSSTTTNVLAH